MCRLDLTLIWNVWGAVVSHVCSFVSLQGKSPTLGCGPGSAMSIPQSLFRDVLLLRTHPSPPLIKTSIDCWLKWPLIIILYTSTLVLMHQDTWTKHIWLKSELRLLLHMYWHSYIFFSEKKKTDYSIKLGKKKKKNFLMCALRYTRIYK